MGGEARLRTTRIGEITYSNSRGFTVALAGQSWYNKKTGEFVVNIPWPEQLTLADYVGVVTGRKEDKIAAARLKLAPALNVKTPLLADCPVNIECIVEKEIELDSHTMFIGRVQAVHVEETLLDANGDVDFARVRGIAYACGTVRERPTYKFRVDELRRAVQSG